MTLLIFEKVKKPEQNNKNNGVKEHILLQILHPPPFAINQLMKRLV